MCKKDPNKKGFFGEFKEFITRGNVIDMAVGVIIGGAFTAIVTALTSGILTPLINYLIGLILGDASLEACRTILGNVFGMDGKVYASLAEMPVDVMVDWTKTNFIDWGAFISAIINFLLVALILFLVIKGINKVHDAGQKAKEKVTKKDKEQVEEKAEEKEEKAE